jgi:hypothetical protein
MLNPDAEAIRRKAEEADHTPVYIALFGQPGAGKSSLINAIVGQQLAKVGVENDVTTERTDYEWNGLFLTKAINGRRARPIVRWPKRDRALERATGERSLRQSVLLNAATAYMNLLRDTAIVDQQDDDYPSAR